MTVDHVEPAQAALFLIVISDIVGGVRGLAWRDIVRVRVRVRVRVSRAQPLQTTAKAPCC
jgi:hypothetical protein